MHRLVICICIAVATLASYVAAQENKAEDPIRHSLEQYQYNLSTSGKAFLLKEANQASYFLLGELHGENEIPGLLRDLWPSMWRSGYRYIAAEVSPWAANQLEFAPNDPLATEVLWSRAEAQFVHSAGVAGSPVLWGCDMEELQPQSLIRESASINPTNRFLQNMVRRVESGYKRSMAPELLQLLHEAGDVRDKAANDASLLSSLEATLQIETYRLRPDTKLSAQVRRESLMKELFLIHYRQHVKAGSKAKVLFRFGRNHLHRGYDERGISTLGNFVAEFAFSENKTVFNVAAFGAGGTASFPRETWNADERNDDLAFQELSSVALYPVTVFDLRPLRPILHAIPDGKRTPLEKRLFYWSNSYDAIICYQKVTPRKW